MQHSDDDRLLDAVRGRLAAHDLGDAELAAADRLGGLARAARNDGLFEAAPSIDAAALARSVLAEVGDSGSDSGRVPGGSADVIPMQRRNSPGLFGRPGLLAAAAAAFAVIAGTAFFLGSREPQVEVVAAADLDLLGDSRGVVAELIEVDDHFEIRVDTAGLSDPAVDSGDGYLEVWMLAPDVSGLISLGPVRDDGQYRLPDGFDPDEMPVVDISLEHFDGDPTHSGNSLVRGQLDL